MIPLEKVAPFIITTTKGSNLRVVCFILKIQAEPLLGRFCLLS